MTKLRVPSVAVRELGP